MAIETPFIMDAKRITFTNSKHNPTRPWFARMISQLIENAYRMKISWNTVGLTVKIHPELWQCISRLYSYGHYFDDSEEYEKNCYLTEYDIEAQRRHEEYLYQKLLPILHRQYPIKLDDSISLSDIIFTTSINDVSGIIKNVNCKVENGDKSRISSIP